MRSPIRGPFGTEPTVPAVGRDEDMDGYVDIGMDVDVDRSAMKVSPRTGRTLRVRPATHEDQAQVVRLITADRPAVPFPATAPVAWDRRPDRTVLVLHDGDGRLQGAMAVHRRTTAGRLTGGVAWLHCREAADAAEALVRTVLARSGGLTAVTAFTDPSPWPPHLPGLPLHRRPVTTRAFLAHGFRPMDHRLLLHRPATSTIDRAALGPRTADAPPLWVSPEGTLHHDRGTVGPPAPAVLWRRNLPRALEELDRAGGRDVLAIVDLLAPGACELATVLAGFGFDELDLLRSMVLT
ncbi:hypothetical protein ACFVVA_00975 [Kitasatospora sp. NPDC058048]|uniref:hypothetical protein n=1 Tax=Kitasatospora sp. NPDC058048 TaxID=3346313 RepID=UPI0036DAC001